MTGTVKVKDNSTYKYKGLTLNILGIHQVYTDESISDIYPINSVEYKLSLIGTEWESSVYTIIHDSHLEDIKIEGSVEVEVWWNKLGEDGIKVIKQLFDKSDTKTKEELYELFQKQVTIKLTENQKEFLLTFFKLDNYAGWRHIATKLIDFGTCVVAGTDCIWNGCIGDFVTVSKAEGYFTCLRYNFNLIEFMSSGFYKSAVIQELNERLIKKNEADNLYHEILTLTSI